MDASSKTLLYLILQKTVFHRKEEEKLAGNTLITYKSVFPANLLFWHGNTLLFPPSSITRRKCREGQATRSIDAAFGRL
jgi:hypothetical protein